LASKTSYLRKKTADHNLGKAAFTMPTTVYAAMFASNPGIAGTQTSELTYTGYARVSVTAIMSVADSVTGVSTNASAITFGAPTSNATSPAAYIALLDASSGGNMLYIELLTEARSIGNGDPAPSFAAGTVTVTET
jgi:hypothetical protein